MAKKESVAADSDPIRQTKAILFDNIESQCTVHQFLIDYLQTPHKKLIGDEIDIKSKLKRYKRAIKSIQIEDNHAAVIFSSVFYWAKFSRLIMTKVEKRELAASIHPQYFRAIHHVDEVSLLSKTHGRAIPLQQLKDDVVAYLIPLENEFWITFKYNQTRDHQEYLMRIPKHKIHGAAFSRLHAIGADLRLLTLELNEAIELYEYYHMDDLWVCASCKAVNQAPTMDCFDDVKLKCSACNTLMDDNNDFHVRQINEMVSGLKLDAKQCNFTAQSEFYRRTTSFHMNIGPNETFDVLGALWNVLSESDRNLTSTVMFSNTLQLTFIQSKILKAPSFTDYLHGVNIDDSLQSLAYAPIDGKEQCKQIKDTFVWLSNYPQLRYPLLRKLIDFRNPGCFVENVDRYTTELELLYETGEPQWLLKEAMEETSNLDATELKQKVSLLEDKYDEDDDVDLDDAMCKGPFIFEIQLQPNAIVITEADAFALNENAQWNRLQRVSNDNYVITFGGDSNASATDFAEFSNIKALMLYKSFRFIHRLNRNELMFSLASENTQQYAATELDNCLTDEKLVEYYKHEPSMEAWAADLSSDFPVFDDDDDDDDCNMRRVKDEIDADNLFKHEHAPLQSPPLKKFKSEHEITRSQYVVLAHAQQQQQLKDEKHVIDVDVDAVKDEKHQLSTSSIEHENENENEIESEEKTQEEEEDVVHEHAPLKRVHAGAKRKRSLSVSSDSSSSSSDEDDVVEYLSPAPTEQKEIESVDSSNNGNSNNCVMIHGVCYAFGEIPIYNCKYYECADFQLGKDFDTADFALLVICSACKEDAFINRDLRGGRSRKQLFPDCNPPAFYSIPDYKYRELFAECFSDDALNDEKLEIDLMAFATEAQKNKRRIYSGIGRQATPRPFIIFGEGFFIKKTMKYRLYTLLRIYRKHFSTGAIYINETQWTPPWMAPVDVVCIVESFGALKMKFECVDLTNCVEDDDEAAVDSDGDCKFKQESQAKPVIVKSEFDDDDDDDI